MLLRSLLLVLVFTFGRADGQIVPEGAALDTLFTGGMTLTEGAAVAPDGRVYFSDITFTFAAEPNAVQAGHIWRYDPATGETEIFRSPSGMSNGIKFDAKGNMIVAQGADFGGRTVIRTDMKTGQSFVIAGLYEGRPFNAPNDISIDERGRFAVRRVGAHAAAQEHRRRALHRGRRALYGRHDHCTLPSHRCRLRTPLLLHVSLARLLLGGRGRACRGRQHYQKAAGGAWLPAGQAGQPD